MVSANPRRSARARRRPSAAAARPPPDPRSGSRRLPSVRRPSSAAAPPRARRSARRLRPAAAARSDPCPHCPRAAVSARLHRDRVGSAQWPRAARVPSDRRRRAEAPSVKPPPRPREASARRPRAARVLSDRRRRAGVPSDRRRAGASEPRRAGASAAAGSAPPRVSSSRTRRAPRSRRCDGRREEREEPRGRVGGIARAHRLYLVQVQVERDTFFSQSIRQSQTTRARIARRRRRVLVFARPRVSAPVRVPVVPFRSLHSVETGGKIFFIATGYASLPMPRLASPRVATPSRQSQGVLAYRPTAARSSS